MLARVCGARRLRSITHQKCILQNYFPSLLATRASSFTHNTPSYRTSAPTKTSTDASPNTKGTFEDPAFARLDLSFNNPKEAFLSKYNSELLRALFVFQMCSFNFVVDRNKEILQLSRKLLGKNFFEKVMRWTVYGHFVAGEDTKEIKPVVERNMSYGVKSILDYSAEKDLSAEETRKAEIKSLGDKSLEHTETQEVTKEEKARQYAPSYALTEASKSSSTARTYFYEDEQKCDENMDHFLRGIDAVSGATNATGFAAVKLTALGRPQFLLQFSEVLDRVNQYFNTLAKGYGTGTLSQKDFERHLKSFNLNPEETRKWYTMLDASHDGEIDLLDWHNLLEVNVSLAKILRVPNIRTGKLEPLVKHLTENEEEQMKNMLKRIDRVLKHAQDQDVRVMIDAEQTYFQAAINRLCIEMMRKYNKNKANVFNTYQCYLKDAHNSLRDGLALSKRENFYFGAKLVRGAYIDQEKFRAQSLGYEDPINPSFEATTQMFENMVEEVMVSINQRPKGEIAVMMATHNEDTVRFVINKMREHQIKSTDKLICFGQLYGMCDQISFSLGQAGYSVYKYVPYGPVEEVLPYLSRRALENRGVLSKVKKEKRMLMSELWRRISRLKWFYKPPMPNIFDQHPTKNQSNSSNNHLNTPDLSNKSG